MLCRKARPAAAPAFSPVYQTLCPPLTFRYHAAAPTSGGLTPHLAGFRAELSELASQYRRAKVAAATQANEGFDVITFMRRAVEGSSEWSLIGQSVNRLGAVRLAESDQPQDQKGAAEKNTVGFGRPALGGVISFYRHRARGQELYLIKPDTT